MTIEQFIPHSIEAEQSVIGAVLLNANAIDDVASLKPEHFYTEAHREIFRVMLDMSSHGRRVDVITLAESLSDAGLDGVTGGLAYLGELVQNTPSASNIKRYAELVSNKATERELLAAAETIKALIGSHGPTKEKLNKAQELVMTITESRQRKQPRRVGDILTDYVAVLERRQNGEVRGVPTGFSTLDERLNGGLQDGNLIIVAGRPSMGKSALTGCIGIHAAEAGHFVAEFSMEMTDIEQIDRAVATLGRLSLQDVLDAKMHGEYGDRIYAAFAKLKELPLIIDDEAGLSVIELMAKARQIKRKEGLNLMIVDALGLMDYDPDKAVSQLGNITKTLKAFAKEMNIPVILLCQLSRKCEERMDKRPVMSDLRDSGNIEQDADVVIMLYRDEYYNPNSPDKGIAEVLIRKNRQGKTGVVPLAFIGDQTRFEVLAGEWTRPETKVAPRKRGFE